MDGDSPATCFTVCNAAPRDFVWLGDQIFSNSDFFLV